MPNIRRPNGAPTLPQNRIGTPERELGGLPEGASAQDLKGLLEANWANVIDGGTLSRREAAWLTALLEHPNTNTSIKQAVLDKCDGARMSDSARAAGFVEVLAALRGGASTSTTTPTPPLPPGPVAPPVTPQPGGTSVLDVRLGRVGTDGAASAGSVAPVAVKLPSDLADIVVDPDDPQKGLALDKAKGLTVGDTKLLNKPSDLFSGALTLNLAEMLPDNPQLAPLKAALDKPFAVRTSNAQYQLEPGKVGNRVIFFGDDHAEIKELIHHPDFKGKGRFIKFMTHWSQTHWEGGPKEAFAHERAVMSSTHGGALIATTNAQGEADIGWLDWPADYGRLRNSEYTANIGFFSLDNLEYTKPLPANWDEIKASTYETMDTMAALQLIAVPFASGDARPWNTNYKFNLLELTSREKMGAFTEMLSRPNDPATLNELKSWSQYCMEGVWNNCNYASMPINQWAVDNGLLSQEALDSFKDMARVFKDAGGLEPGQAKKGWEALKAAGKINDRQLETLESTGMVNVPFKLSRDDVRPYTEYGPKGVPTEGAGEGLTAKPLTLAGLVGGMIQVNFPREKIAAEASQQLAAALEAAPSPDVAAQILGGAYGAMKGLAEKLNAEMQLDIQLPFDPRNPAHHPKIVEAFGNMMAAQLQMAVVTNPDIAKTMHGAIQYDAMDAASQAKVDQLMLGYARVVADFTQSRKDLDKALRALDKKAEDTDVTYGPPINRTGDMMVFVPPQYGWLTYNGAGGTQWPGLQPVADALHESNRVTP